MASDAIPETYRTFEAETTIVRTPRASLWRRFRWYLAGGARRLEFARVIRAAARLSAAGDALGALKVLIGPHETAKVIVTLMMRFPDDWERHRAMLQLVDGTLASLRMERAGRGE
ncbi:MAG: hypothetical protein ACHREM_06520 [Polyangiales bacterium]